MIVAWRLEFGNPFDTNCLDMNKDVCDCCLPIRIGQVWLSSSYKSLLDKMIKKTILNANIEL